VASFWVPKARLSWAVGGRGCNNRPANTRVSRIESFSQSISWVGKLSTFCFSISFSAGVKWVLSVISCNVLFLRLPLPSLRARIDTAIASSRTSSYSQPNENVPCWSLSPSCRLIWLSALASTPSCWNLKGCWGGVGFPSSLRGSSGDFFPSLPHLHLRRAFPAPHHLWQADSQGGQLGIPPGVSCANLWM